MKETDVIKMEFLITLNNNIVIQRYFNVRDYNPTAKFSAELIEYLAEFKGMFMHQLKMKTIDYMLEHSYEIQSNPAVLDTSYTDGPEHFNIFIKQGDMTICQHQIDAKVFPPKIRYTVDIRPHIKTLLSTLTDIFSSKKLSYEYAGITLKH